MKNKPSYEELVNQIAELRRQNDILKLSNASDQISDCEYLKVKSNRDHAFSNNLSESMISDDSSSSDRCMEYKSELKLSEEKLNNSEQRLALAMKGTTDGLFDVDLVANTTYLSPRWKEIVGYRDEEIENEFDSWRKLLHKDDLDAAMQTVNSFLAGKEEIYESEFRMKHKNGTYRSILARGFGVRSESGELIRVTGTHLDITEFKQKVLELEKAKEKIEDSEACHKALHNTPFSGIAIHDKGIVLECNQRLLDLTGYSREDLIGKNGLILVNEESRDIVRKNIASGYEEPYEAVGLHKNGKEFPISLGGRNIEFKGKVVRIVEVTDLTVQKKIEHRLIKAKEHSEENEAKLKKLILTKDKLFSIIGHDLRSPFSYILEYSELLIENDYTVGESEKFLKIINSSAKNTLILLDNLLSWSLIQLDQIKLYPQYLILQQIIEEVIEDLHLFAILKNISLNNIKKNNLEVYADENAIKLILRNLISNAIKFTNSNGKIDICIVQGQNVVEISVLDNGIGMNNEIQDNLFCLDKNVTKRGTANEKGCGLGLILCKEFVEKNGGEIWVESEEGKGSNFKFTLPMH